MTAVLPRSIGAMARAIEVFGSQVRMAEALGVTQPTVCEWSSGVRPVPAERCPTIERLTRDRGLAVTCEQLRPDVEWRVLREFGAVDSVREVA